MKNQNFTHTLKLKNVHPTRGVKIKERFPLRLAPLKCRGRNQLSAKKVTTTKLFHQRPSSIHVAYPPPSAHHPPNPPGSRQHGDTSHVPCTAVSGEYWCRCRGRVWDGSVARAAVCGVASSCTVLRCHISTLSRSPAIAYTVVTTGIHQRSSTNELKKRLGTFWKRGRNRETVVLPPWGLGGRGGG